MEDYDISIVEQRTIEFHGDQILAVRTSDGDIYVPIRPICDLIGVAWPAQRLRINRDLILSEVAASVSVSLTSERHQGVQDVEMMALPLDFLNGWLFGINASRVRSDVQPRLLQYQRDCYRVLSDAFIHDEITHKPEPDIDALLDTDLPAAQAYRVAMAVAQMARQQLVLESRLLSAESSLTETRSELIDLDTRVQLLEAYSGNTERQIDEAQASKIAQAVKAIALEMGKRSGRNEFGGVYGELYRRFDISGYKLLPAVKFEEAIHFLNDWYSSLTDQDIPF